MIPLRNTTKPLTFPVINTILIIFNISIFIYELSLGKGINRFIYHYGLIPGLIFSSHDLSIYDRLSPFITSMFLHGGWMHIIGNMLFLYIFGANIEDRMGHLRYLIFYIVSGLAAALFQIITNIHSIVPMVGASGAISGVLGAYITFYPRSRILTLVPILFFIRLMHVPAAVFIIFWFILQFISGLSALSIDQNAGGVAFWAHIGGFIAGLILARSFQKKRHLRVETLGNYFH